MASITIDPQVGAAMALALEHSRANPFTDPIRSIASALAEASIAAHAGNRDRLVASWATIAGMAIAQAEAALKPGVQVFDGYGEPQVDPNYNPNLTDAQRMLLEVAKTLGWDSSKLGAEHG